MAHPNRRVAPTGTRGNTYSPLRLKLVLFLLTAATLPVVIGALIGWLYNRRVRTARFTCQPRCVAGGCCSRSRSGWRPR